MSELGPEARALLDAARAGATPTAEETARLWGRVSGAVARGAAGGAGLGIAAKIGLAVIAAIAIGGASRVASRVGAPTFVEPRATAPSVAALVRAPVAPIVEAVPTISVEALPRAIATADDDVALVRAAYDALRAGAAARALATVDEHARKHPRSALAPEREATRVLALCALGRTAAARAALDRYRAAFPPSPRLARTCAEAP